MKCETTLTTCSSEGVNSCHECGKKTCPDHTVKDNDEVFCSEECRLDRESDFEDSLLEI